MGYRRYTVEMTPAQRAAWWRRQAAIEGSSYERLGKQKTATGISADKRRVTHLADEWYNQAHCFYWFR